MKRLFWVGVGAAATVVVLRKAREVTDRHVPAGARSALGALGALGTVVETARRELAAGTAEREAELRAALLAGADLTRARSAVDAWRAERADRSAPDAPLGAAEGTRGGVTPVTATGDTVTTTGATAARPGATAAARPGSAAAAGGRRPVDPEDGPIGYSFF